MLRTPELFSQGFHLGNFTLPQELKDHVCREDWVTVDETFRTLTASGGSLFEYLRSFHDFSAIEFIISIRDSQNEWEEDGIWHDDGSRVFAFSLSLTANPKDIEGGILGVRGKSEVEYHQIQTPPFGGIILFLTGIHGYEHRIHQVLSGRRIIIAGWCT